MSPDIELLIVIIVVAGDLSSEGAPVCVRDGRSVYGGRDPQHGGHHHEGKLFSPFKNKNTVC